MRIRVSDLQEGHHIIEEVKGLTKHPIVKKNTIVTNEIKTVLQAFLVEEVEIEEVKQTKENDHSIKLEEPTIHKNRFEINYLSTVEEYKKEFTRWQSGNLVDINKIRKIIIPLYEQLEEEPINILLVQNYVNDYKNYLYHHSVSVGIIAGYIAKKLNLTRGEYYQIVLAGCLSDCGMAKVNPNILQKNILTLSDYQEINLHPTYSYKLIKNIPSLKLETKIAVLQHHERIDGSGYPLKESGNKIHLFSKIIAIADSYHAMICNRVYKEKVSPFKALEVLMYEQFGKFDVSILQMFTKSVTPLAINTTVRLSTGLVGEIVYIDQTNPTRPVIKLLENNEIISLMEYKNIYITDIYLDYL